MDFTRWLFIIFIVAVIAFMVYARYYVAHFESRRGVNDAFDVLTESEGSGER